MLIVDSLGPALGVADDSLRDEDGYRRIAHRICGESVRSCLPVAADGTITGALVATADRTLESAEAKQLNDLADRLSVAITNMSAPSSLASRALARSLSMTTFV